MRILLIGEFSSLHYNLKKGLEEIGHSVTLASNGDGFKNIPRDIDLNGTGGKIRRNLIKLFRTTKTILSASKYDVVQVINPFCLFGQAEVNYLLMRLLRTRSKNLYLLAAGCDAYYWRYSRSKLRYGPFDETLLYDHKKTKHFLSSDKALIINEKIVKIVDGIIPIMYEYSVGYEGTKNKLATIPIPIDIGSIDYQQNRFDEKLVFFHGLNRYGFKGTKHVEQAFEVLKNKYGDSVDFIIEGNMTLEDYLALMSRTNVIVDQTSSYSLGLNGLYALAMGKVVLGGSEPESLEELNIETSPVMNILPNYENIVGVIEGIITNKQMIESASLKGRKFVEKHHNYVGVATKYCEVWNDDMTSRTLMS
ncbi:glycosyltransferase [Vibrio comitans]|uniref:Glycosyl transferase n=1 Tax=Vibrio comitans NBRC 102076 TaxID=1219078 RepID=A0A4Y3IR54_9VIBR|nr:glycosyltransferase [Vibrio comitans]GEA61973.1 hypothetical protein VCO01S_31660 [Vibrio comitans NBRC 102076]